MSVATVLPDLDVPERGAPRRRRTDAAPTMPGRHLRLVEAHDRPSADDRRPAELRVTRRGRLAMTSTVALLLVLAVGSLAGAVMPAAPNESVVVQAGQTLSQIAASELPELPLDRAIVQLQLANDLNTLQVAAGQTLVIPQP